MKTIGIIGGISWGSSIEYYRLMNEMVNKELGGLHSAKILMYSIEFGNFSNEERLTEKDNWDPLNKTMIDAAQRLKNGGSGFYCNSHQYDELTRRGHSSKCQHPCSPHC